MKKSRLLLIAIYFMAVLATGAYAENNIQKFEYISPVVNANLVSRNTNIIVRPGGPLVVGEEYYSSIAIIRGSISGIINYDVFKAADNKTLVITPRKPFEPGERVEISLQAGLPDRNGRQYEAVEWSFTISPKSSKLTIEDENDLETRWHPQPELIIGSSYSPDSNPVINQVSLPSDFPNITINANDNPDSGFLFVSNFNAGSTPYIMILDNSGSPIFYKVLPINGMDFKKHANDYLSYYVHFLDYFYILDSTYTQIDSIQCGNGYGEGTDGHELLFLENGNVLIMGQDPQIVDMSEIIPGGNPQAVVIGLIIQELDTSKNVIWEWRSWDHFEITDATWDVNLLHYSIDYVHGNAIEIDNDENLLLSSRNMDEITKIDRTTGDIIWRWGGENNEFTFVNDNRGFSHQHDIRRLPNGNVTMYDNGNLHPYQYSRALEYELDEEEKIATLVWEYRHDPDLFASVLGNNQRLSNDNRLIGWGGANPTMTEVRPDGSIAYEMAFDPGVVSYRSFRFPWHGVAAAPYLMVETVPTGVHLVFNKFGDTTVARYYVYMDTLPEPTSVVDSTTNTYIDLNEFRFMITHYFRVTAIDNEGNESPFSNEVAAPINMVTLEYLPGDVNMYNGAWPPQVVGADVTYLVNHLRQRPQNPACLLAGFWPSADINGDCAVIGSDVTRLVNYFAGRAIIEYCPNYRSIWDTPADMPDDAPSNWPNCE